MNKQQFYAEAEKLGIGNTPLIPYEEDFDADIFMEITGIDVREKK